MPPAESQPLPSVPTADSENRAGLYPQGRFVAGEWSVAHSGLRPRPGAAVPVAVARGDGIGPEIMDATLRVLKAAGARVTIEEIQVGEAVYRKGHSAGIEPSAWDVLRRTRVLLKAPITTPQGGGYKSLNVTMRKTLGLFANVRPCRSYDPFIATRHPKMDVVIVRENEEDTYGGIEHRQTDEVVQCLKLITRPGCERICRYAFEYARRNGRKKVTCMTKDNIMKLTDGLFHQVFEEVAAEYPEIEKDHLIIDIGAARLAERPEKFDVVITLNLYGDIISDIAAEVSGSVGLAGSANIGQDVAMFEAIHGSAPDIAGQNLANPSGLLLSAVMMLTHIGQGDIATRVHNAWLRAIEDGVHTRDIVSRATTLVVGTGAFADAVIERLGEEPAMLAPVRYAQLAEPITPIVLKPQPRAQKQLAGVDVFVHFDESNRQPEALATRLRATTAGTALALKMITNRGVKVWPEGLPETFCADHWRCRFVSTSAGAPRPMGEVTSADVLGLLGALHAAGIDFVKTEHLYTFDGKPGYSLGQGE
jgi:isocitrate dehydrogenase